jgi:hypothetical protein
MKVMLLFLLSTVLAPCFAQDSLPIPQQQLQRAIQKSIFYQRVEGNKNLVITYLRNETGKKAFDIFFHHRVATNKTPAVACCKISKTFFIIDQAWLNYNFNAPISHPKIKKLANIAGEVLDTFLSEYTVLNQRND